MESLSALIRFAVENGWRVGIVLFLASGGILFADAYNWPHEGVLKSWLDWATIFFISGCALLAASALALLLKGVAWVFAQAWARYRKYLEMLNERREVRDNLQTLNPLEIEALRNVLASGTDRFDVLFERGSPQQALVSKGMLVPVRSIGGGSICKLHPVIQADRDQLLKQLEETLVHHHRKKIPN